MDVALWWSLAVFIASAAGLVLVATGRRRLRQLRDISGELPSPSPAVSVVMTALNEAASIEPALRSLLALDYPDLELIAIDDRSTDATGEILDRLAREFPRLRVLHITTLPAGWLGKNHALHQGAAIARGEYILFTDADIVFERSALRRAIGLCAAEGLDHLAVFPDVLARTTWLRMNMLGGTVGLFAYFQPWKARTSPGHYMGVGAFNLVRSSAYRAAGGHAPLAMEVLDDIMLGKLLGRRPKEVLLGNDMVTVEMYPTAFDLMRGLQKNLFASLDYSAWKLIAATALVANVSLGPWIAVFLTEGAARWLNAGSIAACLAMNADMARMLRYGMGCVVWIPFGAAQMIALYWQTAISAWTSGGITWRGTRYRLEELKKNRLSLPGQ